MSKRDKRKSKQRVKEHRSTGSLFNRLMLRQPDPAQFITQAQTLLKAHKADEALDLLEPLLDTYPRSPELFGLAAVAYIHAGDLWSAISCFERAKKLEPNPLLSATLATLYLQVGLNLYAVQELRYTLKWTEDVEDKQKFQAMLAPLEDDLEKLRQSLGISVTQLETGLRHHDDAQRASNENDFQAAIDACRRAIRFLGAWSPAQNNLAQSLFFNGQLEEALTITRQILGREPNNLHALGNGVKFLAWSGKTLEARALWDRLRAIEPEKEVDRLKQADAAAVLEEDQSVYQILQPLIEAKGGDDPRFNWTALYYFAVAEANLGRTKSAIKHLQELDVDDPRVQPIYEAIKAKRSGLGWATRFAYFNLAEMMPLSEFSKIALLLEQEEMLGTQQFRKRADRIRQQYPQLLQIGKKLIWEEMQPQIGADLLELLGTPEAYAMLRQFGLSQAGSDEERLAILFRLKEAGQLNTEQPVRMWSGGQWSEFELHSYEVNDEPEVTYPPSVVKIFERAIAAHKRDDYAEAERLYKQIITLEPRVADAYYNLGVLYTLQQHHDQAPAMYRKAIEIRPLYVLPRCQLANLLLNEDDIAGAKEILLPLVNTKRFSQKDVPIYMYTQARLLLAEEEYEKARASLESLLRMAPDFTPAKELLEETQRLATLNSGFNNFFGNMRHRQQKRRATMQTKLKTADVTVEMALSVYNREVQGAMARHILSGGGWSGFNKKELNELLVTSLPKSNTLKHIVEGLREDERVALHAVVEDGGTMAWEKFDKQYGNDLDENPDWQYHEPTTLMGRLRQRALLTVATVDKQILVIIPLELRKPLAELL